MANFDIAEAIKNTSMYELACKTIRNLEMSDSEEMIISELDKKFKEIGRTGHDKNHEISAFIQKVLNEEVYNAPDELLDRIFDTNDIDADDDFERIEDVKNTLIAHEAAQGGNVPKSYLDITVCKPIWKNRQVETEISYADLKRDGWKSVAKLTEYAVVALKNTRFKDIFDNIDAAITSGAENYLTVDGATMTQAAADALALHVNDYDEGDGVIVGYHKYIQQMSKLKGYESEDMKNEVHRTGRLGQYDGVDLTPISSVRKLGNGTGLFTDKRVFGIAGKIGTLSQKGEMSVYQTSNNNKEKIELKFANYTYGWAISQEGIKKVFKVALS